MADNQIQKILSDECQLKKIAEAAFNAVDTDKSGNIYINISGFLEKPELK